MPSKKPAVAPGRSVTTRVGKVTITRRNTGIFTSGKFSIEGDLLKIGLANAFDADELSLLKAHCVTDGVFPVWTLDRVQEMVDAVRDDPAATPEMQNDAAEAASWIPTLRDVLANRDRALQELEVLARTGVNVRTCRNLAIKIEGSLRIATELGICLQRLGVRWAEPLTLFGGEAAILWRGRAVRVTKLERRILETVIVADEVLLHKLVKHAWGEMYNSERREKYDQAFKRLNQKIADAELKIQLHVRGDKLIVE